MLVLDAVEHEDWGYQCWNNYEQEVDMKLLMRDSVLML
jgi:hypothetical protein